MTMYDNETKDGVLLMLEQGVPVREISELSKVPANTIYRWKRETDPKPGLASQSPKPTQAVTNEQTDLIQALTDRVAALEGQVDRQTEKLLECFKYVTRKLKEEAKEEEWRESERMSQPGYDPNKPTFVFGKKQ